jgi:uncharacterized protein (DUF2384 family)
LRQYADRTLTTADAPGTTDFWSRAPALFDLAHDLGEALERSDAVGPASVGLKELADAIPATPDPLSHMDPYLRDVLLTAVIHAIRALEDGDRATLRVHVERIRQALRDVLDERPVWRAGPKDAAVWLREQGLTVSDLADVLGASEASVRRWANPEDATTPSDDNADRVIVVAKIVNHLRHAMTARGVVQWLLRPHPALDDRRPIDELKDPSSYRHLIGLASGTRSFVAT